MNKLNLSVSVALLLLLLTACRKEFDDHYHSSGSSTIKSNIVQILEQQSDLTSFVAMIKRANLERTLGESGLYTCFAPRNEAVESFLQANNATIETLPMKTLVQYINYHFMTGVKYYYDFQKEFEGFKPNDKDYYLSYQTAVTFNTRSDSDNKSKYIRVFTQPYLNANAENYKYLREREGSDFMVEGARVSAERDIPASNGVLHIMEDELPFAYRVDEALDRESDLSILKSWIDNFVGYESKAVEGGIIDTSKVKYYNISLTDAKPWKVNLADEEEGRIMIAPTDAAIKEYLAPYMTEDQLGTDYSKIDREFLVPILYTLISSQTSICWGVVDIDRGYPTYRSYSATQIHQQNNISSTYTGSMLSSNAIVYKVNKMPEIPFFQTIEAGLYINKSKYEEWFKMISKEKLDLSYTLTDEFSYQHPSRTLLIQPDSKWDKKVDDYETAYLDTLSWRLRAGIIMMNVKEGEFTKRYYPTSCGYLLYEGNGVLSDFHGNKANLLNNGKAQWAKETGTAYEIDKIFDALMMADTTELMYRKCIQKDDDFLYFDKLCQLTNTDLDAIGYVYTVFAPTNEAFEAYGYTLEAIEGMDEDEAKKLVANHIVTNRRIFTDGSTQGGIQSNGLVVNISGTWDNFRLSTQNGGGRIVPTKCNIQASNGIFHGITGVLK